MNDHDNAGVADAYTDIMGNQLPTNNEQEHEERTKVDSGPLHVKDNRLWADVELMEEEDKG